MIEEQPLTGDDADYLCNKVLEAINGAVMIRLTIVTPIQFVLLGLILWRVW